MCSIYRRRLRYITDFRINDFLIHLIFQYRYIIQNHMLWQWRCR
nr:hypothetical protein [Escherichia coli]